MRSRIVIGMGLVAWVWIVGGQGVCVQTLLAQTQKGKEKVILQCYGLVLAADSVSGLLGAHVYQLPTGRGTSTDPLGYFTLALAAGDTVRVSCRGYKTQAWTIPEDAEESYLNFVYMEEDTLELANLDVFAYPTQKELREMVLNQIPTHEFSDLLPSHALLQIRQQALKNQAYRLEQERRAWYRQNNPAYVPLTPLLLGPLWRAFRRKK
ncbi:MAG: carboxypeptidase-like regulatory domain-containing protein [Cytophagales bacterium]|nr:carboxypeptidase-like regulatory domain-containing protein [Cytophagales bacterium]